jgi:hypothetical protein
MSKKCVAYCTDHLHRLGVFVIARHLGEDVVKVLCAEAAVSVHCVFVAHLIR